MDVSYICVEDFDAPSEKKEKENISPRRRKNYIPHDHHPDLPCLEFCQDDPEGELELLVNFCHQYAKLQRHQENVV